MAISYPTSLDALTNPAAANPLNSPDHAVQHDDVNDAVEALEAKVGIDSSAVTTSIDYRLKATLAYGQAYRTSTFTVTNVSTWYDIDLDAGDNDKVNITHSTVTNPARITVTNAGVYRISTHVSFVRTSAVTAGSTRLYKNNTSEIVGSFAPAINAFTSTYVLSIDHTIITSLAANDYITLQFAGSDAGGTILDVVSTAGSATTAETA